MMRQRWFMFVVMTMACVAFAASKAEKVDPMNAVVKINTRAYVPNYFIPWLDHGQVSSSGSGVVISGNRILTNAHNIAYATYITVSKKSDDDVFEARVKAVDHDCDLALLEVDDPAFFDDITPLEIGKTPPPQTRVAVAGFPMGGDGLSITEGVISRIEVRTYTHSWNNLLAAQLDAAINPGNSGGPVICDGRIVGIAFQINSEGEGLGYMIPTEIIRHFFKDIEDGKVDGFGNVSFTWGGLENKDARTYLKMKKGQTGIRIIKVPKKNQAFLQLDDVLMAIDGVSVANNGNIRTSTGEPRSFRTLMDQKQIGEKVKMSILRKGEEITVELPISRMEYQCKDYLYDRLPDYYVVGGFVFTTLSYSYLDEFGRDDIPRELSQRTSKEKGSDDQEVVVLSIVLADKLNLGYQGARAMIVSKVNGKSVRNLKHLISLVENSKDEYITFSIGELEYPITLNRKKMLRQNPGILKRYRVPSDRSKSLQ